MYAVYFIVYSALSGYLLWFFYLAVMNLARAKHAGTLTHAARILGMPIHFTGLMLDIFLNFTVFSLLVLDWPRELTITDHLNRLLCSQETPRWKRAVCAWICSQLLDAFDHSGDHCKCMEKKNESA